MKKYLKLAVLSSFLLVGCDRFVKVTDKPTETAKATENTTETETSPSETYNTTTEKRTPSEQPSTEKPSTEPPAPEGLSMENINTYISESKPTKISYTSDYSYSTMGVTLNDTATMYVQYDDEVKAKVVYTHESLNDIDADEMISETTATYYLKGDKFGTLQGGSVKWEDPVSSTFMLSRFSIKDTYMEVHSFDGNTFTGKVKAGSEARFLGVSKTSMNSISLELGFNDENKMDRLEVNFKTEKKADVVVLCTYTYTPIQVTIPNE